MNIADIILIALTSITVIGMGYFLTQILKKIFNGEGDSGNLRKPFITSHEHHDITVDEDTITS